MQSEYRYTYSCIGDYGVQLYAAVVCTAVIDLHTLGPRDTACTAVGILRYVNYGMSYVHAQP